MCCRPRNFNERVLWVLSWGYFFFISFLEVFLTLKDLTNRCRMSGNQISWPWRDGRLLFVLWRLDGFICSAGVCTLTSHWIHLICWYWHYYYLSELKFAVHVHLCYVLFINNLQALVHKTQQLEQRPHHEEEPKRFYFLSSLKLKSLRYGEEWKFVFVCL